MIDSGAYAYAKRAATAEVERSEVGVVGVQSEPNAVSRRRVARRKPKASHRAFVVFSVFRRRRSEERGAETEKRARARREKKRRKAFCLFICGVSYGHLNIYK